MFTKCQAWHQSFHMFYLCGTSYQSSETYTVISTSVSVQCIMGTEYMLDEHYRSQKGVKAENTVYRAEVGEGMNRAVCFKEAAGPQERDKPYQCVPWASSVPSLRALLASMKRSQMC